MHMKYKKLSLKNIHKIIDVMNIGLVFFIFIFSFILLTSQIKWTESYSYMTYLRNINNNIIGYISKTEEYYLKEIELKENIISAKPEDLIYLVKTKNLNKVNPIVSGIKEIMNGFNDSKYQRGY